MYEKSLDTRNEFDEYDALDCTRDAQKSPSFKGNP